MATSAMSGSGSVIDVRSIVNQLMQIESRPLQVIQQRSKAADVTISAFSQVKTQVDSLSASVASMQDRLMLNGRSVASSDETAVKPSVKNAALASVGSFQIKDTQFAKPQRTMFGGFKDPTKALGNGDPTRFKLSIEPKEGSLYSFSAVDIEFDSLSLNQIRDKINNTTSLQGKVSASIINTGDHDSGGKGYVLVLTGAETGDKASFDASWQDNVDGESFLYNTDSEGLVLIRTEAGPDGYPVVDPDFDADVNPEGQPQDARATANGIQLRSSSNVFADALPGISFEILKEQGTVTTVSVKDNREVLKQRIVKFAEDLSAVNKKLIDLAKQGSSTGSAGQLAGNTSIVSLGLALSSAYMRGFNITDGVTVGQSYSWTEFGLEYQRDGTVSVNQSVLSAAIDGAGGRSMMQIGFSSVLSESLKPANNRFGGLVGTLSSTLEVLRTSKSRLDASASDTQLRLEKTRARLLSKYAALDSKLAGMQQLGANVRSNLGGL